MIFICKIAILNCSHSFNTIPRSYSFLLLTLECLIIDFVIQYQTFLVVQYYPLLFDCLYLHLKEIMHYLFFPLTFSYICVVFYCIYMYITISLLIYKQFDMFSVTKTQCMHIFFQIYVFCALSLKFILRWVLYLVIFV